MLLAPGQAHGEVGDDIGGGEQLLRVRAFAWSNVTSLVFSIVFAASLLTLVLWMQQVWGYSALQTGLAVAPGPLMVPVFAAVAQRLSRTVPVGRIGVGLPCRPS